MRFRGAGQGNRRRELRHAALGLAILLFGAVRAVAQEPPPCGACAVAVIEPALAERLPAALNGLEVLVPLRPGDEDAAARTIKAIRERGGVPGIVVEELAGLERVRPSELDAGVIVIHLVVAPGDLVAAAFDLKTRITAIRAERATGVRVGLWAPDAVVRELIERDLAPYLDFLVRRSPPPGNLPWWQYADSIADIESILKRPHATASRFLWLAPQEPDRFSRVLSDLAAAAQWLPPGLIPGTAVEIGCADRGSAGVRSRARVWLDPATLNHVAWIRGCGREQVRISPEPAQRDVVELSTGDLLVRVPEPSAERFATGVDVKASRTLSVEEIIARHQAAAAGQAARVRSRISSGTLTLTFEAPGFAAPLAIGSDVVIYDDGSRTDIEQRSIEVNGVAFRERGIPKLPLVEPERVASVPLAIALNDAYEYALAGTETIDGTACYVIDFEPVAGDSPAYRGRAWIAADTFALVRTSAAQIRLRGPIVSSEQVDLFTEVEEGVWLLRESRIHQIYEGAAHRTPIERVLRLTAHEINPPDFGGRRTAAYASPHVMLRDTPEGYRYLQRTTSGESGVPAEVERKIQPPAERVRTVAAGVILDPNITHPLPFAGLSYVDFDLFGTGTQFNGFFGGTFGQLAFSIPSLGRSRWQLAGRAFAVASSFNDRAFDHGREQYDRNIRQRPASASVWLLRPLTPRVTVRAGYDLQYTHYARTDTTRADFIVPAPQTVHALRVAVEGQRAGWNASAWWSPAVRQGWRPWGLPQSDAYDPNHRDFQRFGTSLTKSAVLSPRLVLRGEAAWMDGRDLDRFSRYAFGAFENPLRGYPGALIRYDRGAVLRSAMAWAAARKLRLDVFADAAFVHDPDAGPGLQQFSGFGTAVEVPAPFGTLVAVEWGYGIQARSPDGRRGTHVIKVTGYRIF